MPIINSYSASTNGIGIGAGTTSDQPYLYSVTKNILIPANEKILLIPGKDHAREITLSFSNNISLFFGEDELPFDFLFTGNKYRDNQLGVDLWVKCKTECECLMVIRSVEPLDYLSEPVEPPLISKVSIVGLDSYSNGLKVSDEVIGTYKIRVLFESWFSDYFSHQISIEGYGGIVFKLFHKLLDTNFLMVGSAYPQGTVTFVTYDNNASVQIEDAYNYEGDFIEWEFTGTEQIFRVAQETESGYCPCFLSKVELDEISLIISLKIIPFTYPRSANFPPQQSQAFTELLSFPGS